MRQLLAVLATATFSLAAGLPDAPTLLKEVEAHQLKMDEIRENYTFHRIRRTAELDKKGAVVRTTILERDIFFVHGMQIGRLVKKDGAALSPAEDKAEGERIGKLIKAALKSTRPRRSGAQGLIAQILPMALISNPRRTSLNGRDTLAYDFSGNPNAHAQDTAQQAFRKMSGTVWFDEADRQVARLEVRFDDNFRMGGGLLLSVQKGTSIKIEQAPVGEGLWMQTASDDHIDARVIVKGFRQNVYVNDSDFRKFDVAAVQITGR